MTLNTLNQNGHTLDNVALQAADDSWVIIYDSNLWSTSGTLPAALTNELTRLTSISATIKAVALGPSSSWIIVYGTNSYTASNLPSAMVTDLTAVQNASQSITDVALGPSGDWVILFGQNGSYAAGIPTALFNQLKDTSASTTLTGIAIGPSDCWVLTGAASEFWYSGVPTDMGTDLATINSFSYTITSVALGESGSFAVTYGKNGWYANATRAAGSKTHGNPH